MELVWIGHAAVRIRSGSSELFMDPFPASLGLKPSPAMAQAQVVTASNSSPDHSAVDTISHDPAPRVLTDPGEYEISGLNIKGIRTRLGEPEEGEEQAWNTTFCVEIEGLLVCHVGNPGSRFNDRQIQELSSPHVLIVPAGSPDGLSVPDAVDLINTVSPRIVVPVMYAHAGNHRQLGELAPFLGDLGAARPEPQTRLTITRTTLPEETTVALLTPAGIPA